jgi:hypothetical protein
MTASFRQSSNAVRLKMNTIYFERFFNDSRDNPDFGGTAGYYTRSTSFLMAVTCNGTVPLFIESSVCQDEDENQDEEQWSGGFVLHHTRLEM